MRAGGAIALGLVAPLATALMSLIDLGPGKDSPCGKLVADASKKPVAPPPGKIYRSKSAPSPEIEKPILKQLPQELFPSPD